MKNYFPFLIIIVLSVGLGITYLLNINDLTLINYEPHIRHLLGIAFAICSTSLLFYHFRHSFTSKSHIFAYDSLVALMLGILLCTSIFHEDITFVAMLFFSAVVVIHFGYQRKIYWSYTIATVIIGYGVFLLAGTIFSAEGFRFPLEITPFFILPLSLYLFSLSKDNLLRITMVFVRIMMLYMSFSIIYWSFNHYYLETDFITWTTHKLNFPVNMIGWEEQFKDMLNSNYYSAYFFVNSWSGYFHPSYISVVLCSGLILAFYLYQENTLKTSFSRIELGAYVLLCFVIEALMESRIGMVGFIFIVFSGTLYVSKSKSKYFNLLLIIYIFISLAGFYFFNDAITGFVNDEIRTIYRQLSYEYIYSHPWWGTGYGGQPEVLNPLMKQLYPDSPYVYTPIPYVHNQFLGNMVQFGIWGALVLTIVFLALTIFGIKNKNFYLLLYLGFNFLFMMIEEPLSRQDGIMRFLVFLVFLCLVSKQNKSSNNSVEQNEYK